jgi:hypothetical protein
VFWTVLVAVGFALLAIVALVQGDLEWAAIYSLGSAFMTWQAIRDHRRGEGLRLRRKRNGSRSGESAGELREGDQVSVKADPIQTPDAKRQY